MSERSLIANRKRRVWLFGALRFILAAGIAFFICQLRLDYIENFLYDLRVRTRIAPAVSGEIILISIDSKTQEELRRYPEANDHVLLFESLAKSKPKNVVYANNLIEVIGSYDELEQMAISANKLTGFVVLEDRKIPQRGVLNEFALLPPLQDLRVEAGPLIADSFEFARDGVTRRFAIAMDGGELLHARIAQNYRKQELSSKEFKGEFQNNNTDQAFINFRPAGTYSKFSFVDVANSRISVDTFHDKLVIIGSESQAHADDYILTPFSRDPLSMSRLEAHANIFDTLILNNAPVRLPPWVNLLITSAIAIFTVFVVLTMRPARGLSMLGVIIFASLVVAQLIFSIGNIWIDMAHPFMSIFICYYFFIPYRLIVENRKSWEYYQRNNLLTQVEELKSNFLRMMSHDLKTPLARIQGMTEIALRDIESLNSKQVEALHTIESSSEELSQFIGSVLNLGRIESKEIKLQLKSKDINALLNDVIQKVTYLAKQKNIKIVTEFEPMFSMKIDEDLMRQVFTNLIENAIKYSPENTSILVSTEEINGKVMVQVADQGMGIEQDDINNLFTKFYRSPNVKDSIKGTGLGLYLARYFVDLHLGTISVESEQNRGSTFTVELPMNL